MTGFNCFIDELELKESDITALTFYFFGVLIPDDRPDLEDRVKEILQNAGKRKFHALKTYKDSENKHICDELTDIIITNRMNVICFPFVKNWLNNPSLKILKDFRLQELQKVKFSNYRSMAWLLFIHVFDTFIVSSYSAQKTIIIADNDWLKNEMVVHNGEKLKSLKGIISSTQGKMPLLGLADHAGYLFYRFKQISYQDNGMIRLKQYDQSDYVNTNAVKLFEQLVSNKLFHTLDLWDWIKRENEI